MARVTRDTRQQAYLKAGILGFQGAGKTTTAANMAVGLAKHMQSLGLEDGSKPIFMLDTETGVDWIFDIVDKAGLELDVERSRAFRDLLPYARKAEKEASVLILDSVSHLWTELCDSYQKVRAAKLNRETYRLQFEDWAWLKGQWRQFTDFFVNSRLHIIACGRAGYEYDYFEDDRGKKQLEKTGIKMKAEGEFTFEPSLVIMMDRETDPDTHKVTRTADILKDRSALIDGKRFVNPTFKDFLPHIQKLNLGGSHKSFDASRTSEGMMPADDAPSDMKSVRRQIAVDEIQALMVKHHPTTGTEDKKAKAALLFKYFHTNSWTEVERLMPLADLQAGYDAMHRDLEGKASRYGVQEVPQGPVDELPEFPGDMKEATITPTEPAAAKPAHAATQEITDDERTMLANDFLAGLDAVETGEALVEYLDGVEEIMRLMDKVRQAKIDLAIKKARKRVSTKKQPA